MKKLLLCLAIIGLSAIQSNAQFGAPGTISPYETWSPMWNPSSTYFGTVSTQTSSSLGQQLDTVTTSSAISLSVSNFIAGRTNKVNLDTVVTIPLPGGYGGNISFYAYCAKTTATVPHVLFQLQTCMDGKSWINVPSDSVTISPTSTSVFSGVSYSITSKTGRYYQFAISTTTANASVFCGYYYTKPYSFNITSK